MPDILSQNEVDALLTAVDEGDVNIGGSMEATPQDGESEWQIYDFKRPERVSSEQMASMSMLHEVLARQFGASLSAYLRSIVDVSLASVEQLTYQEFVMSMPNPTCFNLVSCPPLEGKMVLEINPSIVFPIIDKLLGGGGTESSMTVQERELTDIEWRLMSRVTDMVLVILKEIWAPIEDIDFHIEEKNRESNPRLIQIVPPNETVILVCFEIKLGEWSGMLSLCIPFPVIEPKMANFSTVQTWFTYTKTGLEDESSTKLQKGLGLSPLDAVSYVAETNISMRQLLKLKVGDVLLTRKPANAPLLMKVEGKPKFMGMAGQYKGKRAFRVVRAAALTDRI